MKPQIKICGLTRPQDALLAQSLGATALGMICFYDKSPRAASLTQAMEISAAVGGLTHLVAVTVNPDEAEVEQLIREVRVNSIQFHGDESPAFCEQFAFPYFKAIRVKPEADIEAEIDKYPRARGILLDTFVPDVVGGTGKRFDWARAAKIDDPRIIIAGGLTAENIAQAIKSSGARAFDVASGVESAPGIKDYARLRALFETIKSLSHSWV